MELTTRTALVTGASSGIGAATALALGTRGYRVTVTARRAERLHEVADRISEAGGTAHVVAADLADGNGAAVAVAKAVDRFGPLDVLVNNAGYGAWGGILGADLEEVQREVDVNLRATIVATHAAAAGMAERRTGDIVNVSSLAAQFPGPGAVGYATAKAGVSHFSHSVAAELRPLGVRVTLIETGEVATEMQSAEDIASMPMLRAEDVAEAIVYAISQPRGALVRTLQLLPVPTDER